MSAFEKMYFHLFNAITDALRQLEAQDDSKAKQILMDAQRWGENAYLEMTDDREGRAP